MTTSSGNLLRKFCVKCDQITDHTCLSMAERWVCGTCHHESVGGLGLPKEQPRLSMNPGKCQHPKLVPLLKYRGFNQTIQRCLMCGKTMTRRQLREERGARAIRACNVCGRRLRGDHGPAICEECAVELGRMMSR